MFSYQQLHMTQILRICAFDIRRSGARKEQFPISARMCATLTHIDGQSCLRRHTRKEEMSRESGRHDTRATLLIFMSTLC